MKANGIRWVSIKPDFEGDFVISIMRRNRAIAVWYEPSLSSIERMLKIAEDLIGRFTVDLRFNDLSQSFNMLIMLNLPRTSQVI